jgi:hypothetical protein
MRSNVGPTDLAADLICDDSIISPLPCVQNRGHVDRRTTRVSDGSASSIRAGDSPFLPAEAGNGAMVCAARSFPIDYNRYFVALPPADVMIVCRKLCVEAPNYLGINDKADRGNRRTPDLRKDCDSVNFTPGSCHIGSPNAY